MTTEILPSDLKFDFIGASKFFIPISLLLIAASIFIWVERGPSKFGTDFKGGHEILVKLGDGASSNKLRSVLKTSGFSGFLVQEFEAGSKEYSVRLPGETGNSAIVREKLSGALNEGFSGDFEIVKTDFVGPTIGKELRKKALTAVILGLIAILAYITYRFEFAFALGAVAALFHDVIICLGIYLFFGKDLNMASLAAALTIVGYSVNDTIIVFDRIREESFKQKKLTLKELINFSISSTLSRTVITSLLTLFSALALLLFGGGAIADLSLFLVVGIIAGTYSTIFIASPVALIWEYIRRPAVEKAASGA